MFPPDTVEAKGSGSKGLLKSTLQKGIRRGAAPLALRAFYKLWNDRESREAVLRRLSIIGAEEVWPCTADAVYAVGAASRLLKRGVAEDVIAAMLAQLIIRLAGTAKHKDADALQLQANARLAEGEQVNMPLADALAAKDELTAAMVALRQIKVGDKQRVWTVLLEHAAAKGVDVVRVVEAMMIRFGIGALPSDLDLLVAAAILAICRLPSELAVPEGWEEAELPWQAADFHTGPGKAALAAAGKKLGMPARTITRLWWWCCSGLAAPMAPAPENAHWWAARDRELKEIGFANYEEAEAKWKTIEPTMKELVEWALRKSS